MAGRLFELLCIRLANCLMSLGIGIQLRLLVKYTFSYLCKHNFRRILQFYVCKHKSQMQNSVLSTHQPRITETNKQHIMFIYGSKKLC